MFPRLVLEIGRCSAIEAAGNAGADGWPWVCLWRLSCLVMFLILSCKRRTSAVQCSAVQCSVVLCCVGAM